MFKSVTALKLSKDVTYRHTETAFYSSGFTFFLLVSDTLIKDWRSRHIFMVYDLQFCVHNILVLLYDFSSILNPIFEASIIKSQIFITQFLKTSLCNLDSPARSDKGANVQFLKSIGIDPILPACQYNIFSLNSWFIETVFLQKLVIIQQKCLRNLKQWKVDASWDLSGVL